MAPPVQEGKDPAQRVPQLHQPHEAPPHGLQPTSFLLLVVASNLTAMASNLTAMASYLLAMASNLTAMASYLLAMASNLGPSSDGPLSQSSEPVNGSSIKISSIVRPLPPGASGRCPWLSLQLWNFLRAEVARANNNESKGELRPEDFLATLPSLLSEQLWFQQLPGTRHGDPLQTNGLPKGLRGCNHLYIYIYSLLTAYQITQSLTTSPKHRPRSKAVPPPPPNLPGSDLSPRVGP